MPRLSGWRSVWIWLWCLVPQPVAAQVPPPGFEAALFIGADGCVRERSGGGWRARLLADGSPDCGYPPTPLPASRMRDGLPLPFGVPEAEGRLLALMAEGLEAGDFQPPVPAPPPPAMPGHPVLRAIEGAMSAEGMAARTTLSGARPNARLCDLIGATGGGAASVPGADPSRGFCPGDAPDLVSAALRPAATLPVRPADRAVPAPGTASAKITPATAPQRGAPVPKPAVTSSEAARVAAASADADPGATAAKPAPARPGTAPAASRAAAAPAAPPGPRRAAVADAHLIPAGARFLQLGGAVDAAAAEAGFARIAALGLPVARGRIADRDEVLIMAGPFDSRQAIVRAHARLRGAGFATITAR